MIKIFKFFARNLSREFFILVTIFLLALFLRLIYLSHAPLGFYTDEVVSGYVGRFILLNGKDLYGNAWPIFYFDKFGDYRTILPIYLSGVSTFIFGVNEFAVRFPPAFFGALGVIPMYLFTKQLFNRNIAFVSSFLIAILPWHIILSRAQSEGIIGLTILLFGYSLLFFGLRKRRVLILSISAIILLLTYFLYPAFRLIVPLTVLPLPFLQKVENGGLFLDFSSYFL